MYQHKVKISCDTKEKVSKCKASSCLISSESIDFSFLEAYITFGTFFCLRLSKCLLSSVGEKNFLSFFNILTIFNILVVAFYFQTIAFITYQIHRYFLEIYLGNERLVSYQKNKVYSSPNKSCRSLFYYVLVGNNVNEFCMISKLSNDVISSLSFASHTTIVVHFNFECRSL